MKSFLNKIPNEKRKRIYSILTTSLLILFIIHCIGEVIVQIVVKTDKPLTGNDIPCMGMTFGSSIFASLLSSSNSDAQIMISVSSIVTIVLALALVILALSVAKKRLWSLILSSAIYSVDSVLLIVSFIIDNTSQSINIHLSVIDYILSIVLHSIGVLIFVSIYLFYKDLDTLEY